MSGSIGRAVGLLRQSENDYLAVPAKDRFLLCALTPLYK